MAKSVNSEGIDLKRGDTFRPYPEDVLWDWKDNGRAEGEPDPEEIEKKRASLVLHGQLMPVVFTLNHEKRIKLVAGFYRLLGMMKENETRAPESRMRLEGVIKDGNPEEMFAKNIAENRDRKETGPIDDAFNVRRWKEQFGKTDEEICLIYATEIDPKTGRLKPMSSAWLENMRKLLSLPKDLQDKIRRKEISATIGYTLADMAPETRGAALKTAAGDGKPVSAAKVVKAARAQGTLGGVVALKAMEEKAAWAYLQENDKSTKIKKLAATVLMWRSGNLPEPDFFAELHKLLG